MTSMPALLSRAACWPQSGKLQPCGQAITLLGRLSRSCRSGLYKFSGLLRSPGSSMGLCMMVGWLGMKDLHQQCSKVGIVKHPD